MRTRLLPFVLALVVTAVSLFACPRLAAAGEPSPDEIQRRVEWLRGLSPDERARLGKALRAFRALPRAEREALRERAAKVGPERLEALAGRDIAQLARCRKLLAADADAVFESLGEARLAGLTAAERAYFRSEAMRGFEQHLRRRLLGQAHLHADWEKQRPDERRRRLVGAVENAIEERLMTLPDEERARIRALPRAAQAHERARLFRDYRTDETRAFAEQFGRWRVARFLEKPQDARDEIVRRWRERSRWHAVVRVLREEVGISDDARRDLAALGPPEWARVSADLEQSEGQPVPERRARIEELIRRLAGERALDTTGRPEVPPLVQKLRERRIREAPRRAPPR